MRLAALLLSASLLGSSACTGGVRSRPDPLPLPPADAPTAAVPDVRGMALEAAREALESGGFHVGVVEPWPDSLGYPAGTVVAQRPARTTQVAVGTAVDLRVYGISDEDARRAMTESRPLSADVPPAPPPDGPSAVPPPPVTAPPPPIPPAPRGSAGGLESTAVVPDLVGLSLEEATRVARAAGFDVVPLRVAGGTPGQVASQDLPAGREAPLGSPIGIRVGK